MEEIILLKENINMARIMEGDGEDLSSSQEGWGNFFAFFKKCGIEWEFHQHRNRILILILNSEMKLGRKCKLSWSPV